MKVTFDISRIQVLTPRNGRDIIAMDVNLPSPYPKLQYPCSMEIKTANGNGVYYCENVLGLKPNEVIKLC